MNKTSSRHFLSDAAVYGIGGILLQVAGIVLLPLYTHYLTRAEYGLKEIVERIGQIITICLMTTGIRQAAFAFYLQASSQASRERVAATITVFLVAIFAVASAAILILSPIIAPWLHIASPMLLSFGVVAVLAELFMIIPLALMQARVESITFVVISLLMFVVRVALAIVFVAKMGWGVWGVYSSLLITCVTFGVLLTARELRRGSILIDWGKFREIAWFSLPFIPTGICFFMLYNADRFVLAGAASLEALGIYGLGCTIASLATTVAWQPLSSVWTARMYETFELPPATHIVGRMLTRFLTLYSFIALGICLFYREVLAVFAKPEYFAAGAVIAPILLANACMLTSNFMEGVFYVRRKTHWKPWTALFGMTVSLTLYALLIPRYSVQGAIYGTLLGYAAMASMTYFVAQRVFAVRYEWARIVALFGWTAATVFVGSYFPFGVGPFVLKCLLVPFWLTAICITGVVAQDDLSIVQRKLSSLLPLMNRSFSRVACDELIELVASDAAKTQKTQNEPIVSRS